MRKLRYLLLALCALAMLVPVAAPAGPEVAGQGHPDRDNAGRLPPSALNVEELGSVHLTDKQWGIGDVAALGRHAYVAAYAAECWKTPGSPGGGVHIVDFTVPAAPVKVGFVSAGNNAYVGEGVQAFHLKTSKFEGDVLLFSTEPCSGGSAAYGGISLWDVTNPLEPKPLARGVGDRTPRIGKLSAHPSHSAMAWQTGSRAYAVLQGGADGTDVDIMDITDPRKPRMIAERGLAHWPGARSKQSEMGTFPASFHHDVWVKKIDGHWYMLLSYWDSGWIMLNVDNPARPRFLRDSEYPSIDSHTRRRPEGNAHQAVWSADNKYIIGANEDFFAKFTLFLAGSGGSQRFIRATEWPHGALISKRYRTLNGPTLFGGDGCPLVTQVPPSARAGRLRSGEEATLVVLEGGACSYAEKVRAAAAAGYEAVIIAASHTTSSFGTDPYQMNCVESSGGNSYSISVMCINHADFHALFRTPAYYGLVGEAAPAVGALGLKIDVRSIWDGGWGDVRLLDARSLTQIDAYAIPEALQEKYGQGYGVLSVHETKTDPRRGVNLAYASWYSGGLRVLKFGRTGIREVGRYIGRDGNNFWGVYPVAQPVGEPLLLMSDVNHGLFILQYRGPK